MKRVIIFVIIFFLLTSLAYISSASGNIKVDITYLSQTSNAEPEEDKVGNNNFKCYESETKTNEEEHYNETEKFLQRYSKIILPELIKKYGDNFIPIFLNEEIKDDFVDPGKCIYPLRPINVQNQVEDKINNYINNNSRAF